mmetsp:Transcript_15908/g.39610  ORF Transcript_15908/g.39610 Transcript_15908/m.39610 type:complete len:178 (-) Transcript_15908:254-787(-)|eukprot:CAMPEP_0202869002 /NCGR_PEP_ID=MMETSP1391-20130828/11556_1 /ASSEMBLY_ACC=CAM_ASM_000867 /TAXON_ID=1034604 /ORGANISM="Chlamydomonas leiostraca, Strain SAG 11-49" /LENGTH=177 /DNA_ID=CAMNT_0049549235 /DNA_START=155 /DNA_END=688 /DNA_ORIENTATION=-
MAFLMEAPEETSNEQMMICGEDYINCAHPTDMIESASPIEPEYIYNHRHGRHNRLLWRVSWRVEEGKYVPMTFVIDTGAPKMLYLSKKAMDVLESYKGQEVDAEGNARVSDKVIKWDEDLCQQWVTLYGRKCAVERTPSCHEPANIIGLKLIMRLGMSVSDSQPFFSFQPPRSMLHA